MNEQFATATPLVTSVRPSRHAARNRLIATAGFTIAVMLGVSAAVIAAALQMS